MEVVSRPASPSVASAPPRVAIVDADRRIQQSLADLLAVSGEVEVVGRAGDVRAALELVEDTGPDVVLIDPRLPDADAGLALIGGLARAWPGLRIVLTGWNDPDGRAFLNGTACYVSKGGSPEEFVEAIVAGCTD